MKRINLPLMMVLLAPVYVFAQDTLPYYLKDRGTGLATSMFGTYINGGELIVYPFYEYYHDKDAEYAPNELGGSSDIDYRGKFTAHETLLFLGYGISDKLAIELEAAYMSAKLIRASDDPEAPGRVVKESGLGDVESQLRWRWNKESERTPEIFSYFETVFPFQKDKQLIGTQDWEFKLGTGIMKGFKWGTMTLRLAGEYDAAEDLFEAGEYAIEYLKRVSPFFRFYVGVEGSQDEVELIADLQFHISGRVFIRVNNAFGVTSKATDYAPELGILFTFR